MARKAEALRTFNVAVVGLSGTEKEKGNAGVGKSCLCNRFLRPLADEYYTDHISVLSQTDFSGRVVNNDHFLYWGEVTKTSDEGVDFHFQIIEQTEFIDDASFQAFKGGKMDPYIKRCSATKLTSAEKLMYICKNQLGIEKEYEQKVLPDGRFSVDGFVCCFDVSDVQNRSLDKEVDYTAAILNNLMKTKKPVVLVTTKSDEATESHQREMERLLSRKEFKGSIPMVETSAHENVNVDLAFFIVAQAIDRSRGRAKIVSFVDAARARREVLDVATDAFLTLIKRQVTDYRVTWNATYKRLQQHHDFVHYCELFAQEKALREFRRHIKRLKEEFVHKKMQSYLSVLPEVLHELLPDLSSVIDSDWASVRCQLRGNPDFGQYFVECPEDTPWQDSDLLDSTDTRIPFDMLETPEAETCFRNHVNDLQLKERRLEMRKQFKQLLEEAGYVTPGKSLSEVKVLFMGRECFEALPEDDCLEIYDFHQKEITERARQNFQELLLEQADLFYHFTSIAPAGAITQDDIKDIVDVLQEDSRYKALDRLDQDRKLMLLRHLGFVHYPIKEHCPAFPCCMDCLIENVISSKANRINALTNCNQWILNSDSNQLNLVVLGSGGIAEALANEIKVHFEDDEYELDNVLYTLEYRIISGDVSLPQNSFQTADFFPHGLQKKEPLRGCFCVYSTTESYEYVRDSLEKTLLANLEQEDRLPFQGLPIVILFAADSSLGEKDLLYLREEGQNLSDSLQCQFIDVTEESSNENSIFSEAQLSHALQMLVESIQHRVGSMTIYRTQPTIAEPDIRVIMCLLCGDPYTVENMLGPILNHQCCVVLSQRSILLETYLGDSKRRVEVIVSSYHGANAFREELIHGFILVYSTKRKASLSTLSTFSMNIPNLPIQILAVTDSGGANAFFSNDLSHSLITDGNAVADRLQARFMTSASSSQQKTALYIPFFKEVWDKKPEIEQAFNMDDSSHGQMDHMSGDADDIMDQKGLAHRTDTLSKHRASSMDGSADSESHYERLPMDGSLAEDLEEPPSPSYVDDPEAPLVPSDDSDVYQNVLGHENGEHFVKRNQLPRRKSLHGWTDDNILPRSFGENWTHHGRFQSYTTGRRKVPPPIKPKPGGKPKVAEPGKLDLKNFSNVTNAIAKLNLGAKEQGTPKLTKMGTVYAPLATPESIELGPDYAQVKDALPLRWRMNDSEYATVHDALPGGRIPRVRQPGRREFSKAKLQMEHLEDDSSLELLSPKDGNSRFVASIKVDKTGRRKDKQKTKEDEKLEKRRQKEEEKQKRLAEKKEEKEKKKHKKGGTLKSGGLSHYPTQLLEEFAQSDDNPIPLFLEKCIQFVEEEGLDSEGIYRVPGNRAHVELLFQRFDEDPNVTIRELDIPVNAVATALKDFFSKRLPPLLSQDDMNKLVEISTRQDRSCRLLELCKLVKKLPSVNNEILKFVFQHFVRVSENCKLNSMDSKNLAICWWPTLLPIQFTDMGVFERMRPHLEDAVQTMIDQFRFLFCDLEDVVMV